MSRIKKGAAIGGLAVALVGGFEGLRLNAYRDPIGIPTACYGETRGIKMGMKFTKDQCDEMLLRGLQDFEKGVLACTKVPLPDARLVGLVSFSYNVGVSGYCKSSVAKLLNSGHTRAGCDALLRWNRAGGVVFPGLTRRRQAERELCMRGL